jgi:tetratricopeptide (TPR) repeat protein
MHQLAHLYQQAGRVPEAVALFEQSLAKRMATRPDAVLTLNYMTCLASAYQEAGRFDRAEPLLVDVLARHRKADRPLSNDDTVPVLIGLGLNDLKQRKYADAEPLLRELLKFREQNESDDWRTFNTRSMLGGSLLGQKKYADSEPLLLAGYEGMKQREGTIPPQGKIRLSEAIERLVQLYEAWGQPGKAAVWKSRLGRTDLPADVSARP